MDIVNLNVKDLISKMYEEVVKGGKIEVNECGVHDNEVDNGGVNDGGGNEEEVNDRGVDDMFDE